MSAADQILAGQGRQPLVGRARERRLIDALLEEVRGGRSAVLVLRGEAGVGKTALLDYAAGQAAAEFRVRTVAGIESEVELPFAALHHLCSPRLRHLDALPEPHRNALRVAFGIASGPPADRFSIALAVLALVADVATERPVLCIVDDAQWLDTASAQILGLVARRLGAEPVGLIFAARSGASADVLDGLPELAIGGLDTYEAETLLSTAAAAPLDPRVRERLIAETGGNPLALLELAPLVTATSLSVESGLAAPQQLARRIETSFAARVEWLSEDARRLLLLAAVEPVGEPEVLSHAAERLGIDLGGAALEVEHLLTVGEQVTFQHPLVRSAVYRAAQPDERRAAHLAVARALDREGDADHRAWQLAAAARGPDEVAASELERSAGRAQARGGYVAAAAFLQRAVALTRDPARRTARSLAAAQASLHAGTFDSARESLVAAGMGAPDARQAAQVGLLRGQLAFAAGSPAEASALLLEAGRRLEPLDLSLARETYLGACGAAMFAGPAGASDLRAIGEAARVLERPPGGPRPIDVLLDGLALLLCEGRAAAAPTLIRAIEAFASDDVPTEMSLRWGWMATAASNALWDEEGLRAISRRHIRLAREVGALEPLPIHLIALGSLSARAGDAAAATSLMAEAAAVADLTGTRMSPFTAQLMLAAFGGSTTDFAALKQPAVDRAASAGQELIIAVAEWTEAVLFNGLGRYADALVAARRATAPEGDLFAAMWALPELVEAATRVGERDIALDALDRLAETTRPAGTGYGLGVEARSRALAAADGDAEVLYLEAIEQLSRTPMRSELARAHLVYGEWLRRARQRRKGREQLHTARTMFIDMGMNAFAERAGRELVAAGVGGRARAGTSRSTLTPQEDQVAGLARDGLSNAEIAIRLFLSPSTVEWHLKKVFAKLGISSRQALRDALPSPRLGRAGGVARVRRP